MKRNRPRQINTSISNFILQDSYSASSPGRWAGGGGGGGLALMAYTERLRPKGVPFSDFRYMKG